jgi:hypothetical protein
MPATPPTAAQGTSSLTPLRARPPDPRGTLPTRARDHVRGAQPRGPAIPLAVSRRSHAGGSSAPLRSAPRRGASRGWGFEAALRRAARSPVVTRAVSHGSEPIHCRSRESKKPSRGVGWDIHGGVGSAHASMDVPPFSQSSVTGMRAPGPVSLPSGRRGSSSMPGL